MVKTLLDGFENFRKEYFSENSVFFQKLVRKGQSPKIMVVCCSDSRVDPAILFGLKPGDLFVVRNVANLIPPYRSDDQFQGVSAALEFGVKDLAVSDIVVLGHAFCGGISALCKRVINENKNEHNTEKKDVDRDFINKWVDIAKPALKDVNFDDWPGHSQHEAEKKAILNSVANLKTFPWIKDAINNKKLSVHGWWFDMENGALWGNKGSSNEFVKLVPEPV
jgi:carbonic anhydrase